MAIRRCKAIYLNIRTPSSILSECPTNDGPDTDAYTHGADNDALVGGHFVQRDGIRDDGKSALKQTGSADPKQSSTKYENIGGWR
jgi:hypothetical protein